MSGISNPARKKVEKKPLPEEAEARNGKCICVVEIESTVWRRPVQREQKMRLEKDTDHLRHYRP